ncbi:MAG: oligopeptide:H+ symporter [Steroidobacteraceae bacterium]
MHESTTVVSPTQGRTLFGHPIGLVNLFFTEMWERFSFYGMRALLVLFLVDRTRGGFGLDDRTAAAIYGLYNAAVYMLSVPGGWIADRLLGAQRAVIGGGLIIACGHVLLGIGTLRPVFFLGLLAIVLGTALLKPNVSAIVAQLYPEGGARRDAGFSIRRRAARPRAGLPAGSRCTTAGMPASCSPPSACSSVSRSSPGSATRWARRGSTRSRRAATRRSASIRGPGAGSAASCSASRCWSRWCGAACCTSSR